MFKNRFVEGLREWRQIVALNSKGFFKDSVENSNLNGHEFVKFDIIILSWLVDYDNTKYICSFFNYIL